MDRRTFIQATGTAAGGLALGGLPVRAQEAAPVVPVDYLHAYTHRLDIERGLKLHCLVPRLVDGAYGGHEYAGFFTCRVDDEPWMFVGDQLPERLALPDSLADLRQGTFALRRRGPSWRIDQRCLWVAAHPAVWLSATGLSERDSLLTGALMGWAWAERALATDWLIHGEPVHRALGGVLEFAAGVRWLAYRDENGPFHGLLVFDEPPRRVWADDDGLYWEWATPAAGAETVAPVVAYALVPGEFDADAAAVLAEGLLPPPTGLNVAVLPGENPSWIAIADGAQTVPVPPALAPLQQTREGLSIPTAAGPLLLMPGTGCSLLLTPPRELETPLPGLEADGIVAEELVEHVVGVLDHRLPDGRFGFALGRTFYDGITCAALAQALPVLEDPLRDQTAAAVRTCLEALCDQHVRSAAYGLLVPPEMPSFTESAIDYPEITATLLYAMLAYSLNADRNYPATRRELIETHIRQIAEMTSPCGTAWARADTQHLHAIAESAIGGLVAWGSLYHLGKLLEAPWAGECRARAALAWTGYRNLFRWRDEYGDAGVVNGWSNWRAEIQSDPPWTYVQSTWFSFVPFVPMEAEDRYGTWRSLRAQPWWEWTGKLESRQRGYDYCNALALARAGLVREVQEHWPAVAERPFWWDTFDASPVLAIAALPQLAALGVRRE